jgi:hypothetical protein
LISDPQVVVEGEDIRNFMPSFFQLRSTVFSKLPKGFDPLKKDGGFLTHLHCLKTFRMVEIHAGYYGEGEIIPYTRLPLTTQRVVKYTWEQLKAWVSDKNIGVIVHIPRHAVLVFALGEDRDTGANKY